MGKYCDDFSCEAEATERVRVSVTSSHSEWRHYCASHYDVYMVGVQHGRYHESACYGTVPTHGDSQTRPKAKEVMLNRQYMLQSFTNNELLLELRRRLSHYEPEIE